MHFNLEFGNLKKEKWSKREIRPLKWLRRTANRTNGKYRNALLNDNDDNAYDYNSSNTSDINEDANTHCYNKYFDEVLLIVGFGATTEFESIPLFELLYKKTFKNRIYCGVSNIPNQTEINVLVTDTRLGAFLYSCINNAMTTYPEYRGYLFIGEEILLNFWNLKGLDLNKIWEDDLVQLGPILYEQHNEDWEWWESPWGVRAMEKVFEYLVELNYYDNRKTKLTNGDWSPEWDAGQSLNKWLWNGAGDYRCYWSTRTVVYIPNQYSQLYLNISKHFRASGVRHGIALPTILRLLSLSKDFIKLTSTEINADNQGNFLTDRTFLQEASENKQFVYIHGNRKDRRAILNDLRLKEYAVGKFLEYRHC